MKKVIILIIVVLAVYLGYTLLTREAGPVDNGNGGEQLLPAAAAVRSLVASQANVSEAEVAVLSAEPREWPDACLGLAAEEELCAQVITPGYEVRIEISSQAVIYRTNLAGTEIRVE